MRWLRPEFQNPAATAAPLQTEMEAEEPAAAVAAKPSEVPPWPKELRDQVSAVRDLFTRDSRAAKSWTVEDVARAFRGSRRSDVASVLDALSSLGILLSFETESGRQWRAA